MNANGKTYIRHHRDQAGLSQSEFAELSGVSKTAISEIEIRRQKARPETRNKIAEAIGVSVRSLFLPNGLAKSMPRNGETDPPVAVPAQDSQHSDDEWIRTDEAATLSRTCLSSIERLIYGTRNRAPVLDRIVRDDLIWVHKPTLLAHVQKVRTQGSRPMTPWMQDIEAARKPCTNHLQDLAKELFSTPEGLAAIIEQLQRQGGLP